MKRFWAKVDRQPGGCWNWTASTGNAGYGRFRVGKKFISPHRLSFELFTGQNPKDKVICHTCDNPRCVNPKHLFVGTQKDNMMDCASKGRNALTKAKLTEQDVRDIRTEYNLGTTTYVELAKKYNVRKNAIGLIIRGETWSHVK